MLVETVEPYHETCNYNITLWDKSVLSEDYTLIDRNDTLFGDNNGEVAELVDEQFDKDRYLNTEYPYKSCIQTVLGLDWLDDNVDQYIEFDDPDVTFPYTHCDLYSDYLDNIGFNVLTNWSDFKGWK